MSRAAELEFERIKKLQEEAMAKLQEVEYTVVCEEDNKNAN